MRSATQNLTAVTGRFIALLSGVYLVLFCLQTFYCGCEVKFFLQNINRES